MTRYHPVSFDFDNEHNDFYAECPFCGTHVRGYFEPRGIFVVLKTPRCSHYAGKIQTHYDVKALFIKEGHP